FAWDGSGTNGSAAAKPEARILVSAGGGIVGEPLYRAAVEAQAILFPSHRVPMRVVTAPFLPESARRALPVLSKTTPGVEVRRWVPDLCAEMRASAISISQCGYNTALDILRSGVRGLVVPFAEGNEDEQTKRARKLEGLGSVRVLESARLS